MAANSAIIKEVHEGSSWRIACSLSTDEPGPRMLPGQHFIEDDAEREQIAALIDVLTQNLLRRHVGDRTEDLTRPAQRLRCGSWSRAEDVGIRFARPKSSTFT